MPALAVFYGTSYADVYAAIAGGPFDADRMRWSGGTLCALIPHPSRPTKSYSHWRSVGEHLKGLAASRAPFVIREATVDDSERLGELFDAYRRFYGRGADIGGATRYVRERLDGPTRFFIEHDGAAMRGFVHLLPSFDTLGMRPMWILEDLFVEPAARRSGVGSALLRHAEWFARETGASRLTLSTAHTNTTAQRLYEAHGWVVDQEFRYYHRMLS